MLFRSPPLIRLGHAYAALVLLSHPSSQAATLTTLIDFTGANDPAKGAAPRGALLLAAGHLWGATEVGAPVSPFGHGSLFKFSLATSTLTTFTELAGTTTGSRPMAGLTLTRDGQYFYGTTLAGGVNNLGTVFQMLPDGTHSVVFEFRSVTESSIGSKPTESLVEGPDGFMYGTTSAGGLGNVGTLFRIAKAVPSTPVTLVEFTGSSGLRRGKTPLALTLGKDGHLYGLTETSGALGGGTFFRLTTGGVFTTLADFGGSTGKPPRTPRAALIQGDDGLFYGTTAEGGANGLGTVFSVSAAGKVTVLASFSGTSGTAKGSVCAAPLLQATDGRFYGVTSKGGASDRGTIFRIGKGTPFETLVEFTGNGVSQPGSTPLSPLVQDNEGNFYGSTSSSGANGAGTLFKLSGVLPAKPVVSTLAPISVKGTSATLIGMVNTLTTAGTYYFEYGTTTDYGSKVPLTPGTLNTNNTTVSRTATVTDLQPGTEYHYRIVAGNGGGYTRGNDFSFTTGPHPTILNQPDDLLVGIGEAATFSVQSSGTAAGTPVTYAWLKNSAGSTLGTQATYTIPKVATIHAGNYSVRVTKTPDTVLSSTARLGVIDEKDVRVNAIQGGTVTLQLNHAAPAGALSFQWKKDNTDIPGANAATLVMTGVTDANNGVYTCQVAMGGLTKTSGEHTVSVLMKPVINAVTLGPWTTNGFILPGQQVSATNNPTSFASPNLPQGVVMHKTTGVLTGRPVNDGDYEITFIARNAAGESTLRVPVTVYAPEPLTVGTFNGLITRAAGNAELGGSVNLTITGTGAVTGKMIYGGRNYSFTSKLSDAPEATRTIVPASVAGTPAVAAIFTLTEATGVVTGFVSGASVIAKRQAPQAAPKVGRYNLGFSTTVPDSTNVALPQGSGFGTLTVGVNGSATWVCRLGDNNANGVVFTVASSIAVDGSVPLHKSLYATATGSAQGWLAIDTAQVITEQSFDWLKNAQPPTSTTRSYKNGFALHTLEADGGKYSKPATGQQVLGFVGSSNNAEIEFAMGGLPSPIVQGFSFPSSNVPQVPASANVISMKLDLDLGTFSGNITVPDAAPSNVRKVNYVGVLLPHLKLGIGQFQMPQLPNQGTSPLLSGRVVVRPVAAASVP